MESVLNIERSLARSFDEISIIQFLFKYAAAVLVCLPIILFCRRIFHLLPLWIPPSAQLAVEKREWDSVEKSTICKSHAQRTSPLCRWLQQHCSDGDYFISIFWLRIPAAWNVNSEAVTSVQNEFAYASTSQIERSPNRQSRERRSRQKHSAQPTHCRRRNYSMKI